MVWLIQQNIEEKEMTKETDKRAETKKEEKPKHSGLRRPLK
jgi:hypothetical protein